MFQPLSLDDLLRQHVRSYAVWPEPLQALLKRSVLLTLLTEVGLLLAFVFVPPNVWTLLVVQEQGGFFLVGGDYLNTITAFGYQALPYLVLLNLVMLFVTLMILTLTLFMTMPVPILMHRLAAAHVFPTMLSWGSLLVLAVCFAVAIVINLVIWVIIIWLTLTVIWVFLSSLGNN